MAQPLLTAEGVKDNEAPPAYNPSAYNDNTNASIPPSMQLVHSDSNISNNNDENKPKPWLTNEITIGLAKNNEYNDLKTILQSQYNLNGAELIMAAQNMINLYTGRDLDSSQTPQQLQPQTEMKQQNIIIVPTATTATATTDELQSQVTYIRNGRIPYGSPFAVDRNPIIWATSLLFSLGFSGMGIILGGFCVAIHYDLNDYYSYSSSHGIECVLEYLKEDAIEEFGIISFFVLILSGILMWSGCCILNIRKLPNNAWFVLIYIGIIFVNIGLIVYLWTLVHYLDYRVLRDIIDDCPSEVIGDAEEIEQDFLSLYLVVISMAVIVFCCIFGVIKGGHQEDIWGNFQ